MPEANAGWRVDLGRMPYADALPLMEAANRARQQDHIPDTLLFVEHEPVFTLGRSRSAESQVLAPGEIPVVPVGRGGGVTYHGPGQIVGYPIVRLRDPAAGPVTFLRLIEEVLMATLDDYGVDAHRREGLTGLWIGEQKVASIGIGVRGGVTLHGFALNVRANLEHFRRVNPCGLQASVMVNMQDFVHTEIAVSLLQDRISERFARFWRAGLSSVPSSLLVDTLSAVQES